MKVLSEKDSGMYDAINKGFSLATGDIMAYINADDKYAPDVFDIIRKVFEGTDLKWIKGITSYIDSNSQLISPGILNLYQREWLQAGIYGRQLYFVQQDSVFWTSEMWSNIGKIDINFKLAGDMWLWAEFAKFSSLVSINLNVSSFRIHSGQLSSNLAKYLKEASLIKFSNLSLFEKLKLKVLLHMEGGRLRSLIPSVKRAIYVILFPFQSYTFLDVLTMRTITSKVPWCQFERLK